MKRLLCAYRNASLRVKLSLLVTAVLLTVLIACQVALYFYVAENVERQARSAADVTLTDLYGRKAAQCSGAAVLYSARPEL